MLSKVIARSVHELDRLKPHWALLASGHSLFQTFLWSRLAVKIFHDAAVPYVVFTETDSGMALIPAAVMGGGSNVGLLGEALFDYRTVLSSGDESVMRSAWAEIASLGLPLNFFSLRGETERERWSEFEPRSFYNAPCANPLDVSSDAFLVRHARLAGRARKILRKGISLHRYNGAESALVRLIYERKSEQPTPQGNVFVDPLRREFMVQVASADPSACEIFTYETGGELVGALVSFRHENIRHFYTIYYDIRWSGLSPGQCLVYEITAQSLAEGMTCDFMTGEQPYKLRVATGSVPLYRVDASPTIIASVARGSIATPQVA